ncbi:Phosphodiesterase [Seminavis robusta]|uniref:Phosphodiesterase n=1 Tax=Seminavis robusta TaxID=568900 RepID=A0A9N8DVX5_9STRA|nr:Phosphodiesterase [Seminavis robusta]|eukprot:Sro402_g135500.1 Phosphodiesterase (474) ;mRNA; r:48163-49661
MVRKCVLMATLVAVMQMILVSAQPALPNGVVLGAVGGVTRTSAVIGFRTQSASRVQVVYHVCNNNRQFNTNSPSLQVSGQTVTTRNNDDLTGSIQLNNLTPDTRYCYRIRVDGAIQNVPDVYEQMFKTFPSYSTSFEFSVFSDCSNNGEHDSPARAYVAGGHIGNYDPLFALQIGDFDHTDPMSIQASREMHRRVRDTRYQAGAQFTAHIMTKMALYHIWDDHDYCDNDSDRFCVNKEGATKAFREYFPGYPYANPQNGLWYSFRAGPAELFVVDTRSRRDPGAWPDIAGKSMLDGGNSIADDQITWLLNGLRSSSATWKIIVSSTGANQYARIMTTQDNWTAYRTEAARIRQFIETNNLRNIVMISGDIHTGGGIDDGRNSLWGIPEVTVPHTNLQTGWNIQHVGTWSHGVVSGDNSQRRGEGFVSVAVSTRALRIRVCDRDGQAKLTMTLNARGNVRRRSHGSEGLDEVFP